MCVRRRPVGPERGVVRARSPPPQQGRQPGDRGPDECLQCARLVERNKRATRAKRTAQQCVRRLKVTISRLRKQIKALTQELHTKTSLLRKPNRERTNRRKSSRGVVSLQGGYQCAMKRNMGHAGADALLSHVDGDVSRSALNVFLFPPIKCFWLFPGRKESRISMPLSSCPFGFEMHPLHPW